MSVTIKSEREIELIRKSCHIIAKIHQDLGKELKAGMSTLEVDSLAEDMIRSYGCVPNFKNYGGFLDLYVSPSIMRWYTEFHLPNE